MFVSVFKKYAKYNFFHLQVLQFSFLFSDTAKRDDKKPYQPDISLSARDKKPPVPDLGISCLTWIPHE